MRFSDWIPLDEKDTDIPRRPGLFQIRIRDGLLVYPYGKSAMYFYGYADNLQQGFANFQQTMLPHLERPSSELLIRWMQVEDFQTRFKRHLDEFYQKFGSLPQGNETILRHQNGDEA